MRRLKKPELNAVELKIPWRMIRNKYFWVSKDYRHTALEIDLNSYIFKAEIKIVISNIGNSKIRIEDDGDCLDIWYGGRKNCEIYARYNNGNIENISINTLYNFLNGGKKTKLQETVATAQEKVRGCA